MSISEKHRREIFGLARELGLDDDDRKAIQRKVTGKDSITSMTPLEGARVIDHLRALRGPGRRYPKRAGRVPKTLDREPLLWKIEALLADMKLSWEYAESIAWRITGGRGEQPGRQPGVRRMEWVTDLRDLRAVIAALHVEQRKRSALTHVMAELQRLNRDVEWLEAELFPDSKARWQRNARDLQFAIDWLANQPTPESQP